MSDHTTILIAMLMLCVTLIVAGEVAEKVKKLWRNNGVKGGITVEDSPKAVEIVKELGDVLWYAAALSTELGIDFSEVAEKNIRKLSDRVARGVIKSEGDNR